MVRRTFGTNVLYKKGTYCNTALHLTMPVFEYFWYRSWEKDLQASGLDGLCRGRAHVGLVRFANWTVMHSKRDCPPSTGALVAMSFDYVILHEQPNPIRRIVTPMKALAGTLGMMLVGGSSGWLMKKFHHAVESIPKTVPKPVTAWPEFTPRQGYEAVAIKPNNPSFLSLVVPPSDDVSLEMLFIYPGLVSIGQEPEIGNFVTEGWVYGARLEASDQGVKNVAVPTGESGDIVKGLLLSWAKHKEDHAAIVHKLDECVEKGTLSRGMVNVVTSDGHSIKALWYYKGAGVKKETHPSPKQGSDGRELMRAAYNSRYTWDPSFGGYTGTCIYETMDTYAQATFTVPPDVMKASVDPGSCDDKEAEKAMTGQLWEIAIHRIRRTFDQTHGENTFTVGDTNEWGTELIVGGKNAGDRYRVKNNVVTMVHRKIRDVVVTIYTESVTETGEGYVSKKYTSQYSDPATGEPKGVKQSFVDTFVKITKGGPWTLAERVIRSDDKKPQKFLFKDFKLLSHAGAPSPGQDATAMMRAAYDHRYTWDPSFQGYTGTAIYEADGKKVSATFTVPHDVMKASVDAGSVNDEAAKQALNGQLWEIAIHRIRRTFEQTHGENTFVAGDTNEMGTEIIVGGKNAGDRYRVKGNVVTMVHRKIRDTVVTIFTLSVTETGQGYVSKQYTSQYSDPQSGLPKGAKSNFLDTFVQIAPGTPWTLSERVIQTEDGKTQKYIFKDFKLIKGNSAERAAAGKEEHAVHSALAAGSDGKELMRAAYNSRYTWDPSFKGYTGTASYESEGKKVNASFTVPQDFMKASLDAGSAGDEEAKKVLNGQLWEVAIHRIRRTFEQTHGENTFTVGDTNEWGTELIVGGKNAGDRYRVKNNVVTMVHRKIRDVVVTIYTESVTETGEGYVSKKYTSQYSDPETGKPRGGKQSFVDSFVQIAPGAPWTLSERVIKTEDGKTQKFAFKNFKLL
eukprot:g24232.t1